MRPAIASAWRSSSIRVRTTAAESVAPASRSHQPSAPAGGSPANTFTTSTSPALASTCQHESTASSKWGERMTASGPIAAHYCAPACSHRETVAKACIRRSARSPDASDSVLDCACRDASSSSECECATPVRRVPATDETEASALQCARRSLSPWQRSTSGSRSSDPVGDVGLPHLVRQLGLEADQAAAGPLLRLCEDEALSSENAPDRREGGNVFPLLGEVVGDRCRRGIVALLLLARCAAQRSPQRPHAGSRACTIAAVLTSAQTPHSPPRGSGPTACRSNCDALHEPPPAH